ncbi:MAG: class I fructose-bisphosphate aldolase [Gammaproteobacteria bacterium]
MGWRGQADRAAGEGRAGKAENLAAAQKALHHRAKCNGLAMLGKYTSAMELQLAA